ncbi:MAG TPA: ribbon-helix-helix protein, CopG family [Nocardioidaceae bacterium]|nr:ribbon-helix-helix protein, CopG family [Nocardioidaceae bacterium]
MQRTQISLTEDDRRLLDEEAARSGRSVSALIREAVRSRFGSERSTEQDLATMRTAFGAWGERKVDGAGWVDELRSASRLARRDS